MGLTNSNINKIPISPHLCIIINNISCWSLLDSGSQVTAISEEFYNKLKSQNNKMLEMPVSNVLVSTAIGKNNYKSAHVFLVVPYLSCDVILGNDWNLENGLIINYNNINLYLLKIKKYQQS